MKRIYLILTIILWLIPQAVRAEGLVFPGNCDTAEKRLAYSCRAKKLLIDVHNVFAVWARDGMTQGEYDNGMAASVPDNISQLTVIPDKLKVLYPYNDGFDIPKMEQFITDEYTPRQMHISESLGKNRALYTRELEPLTTWDSDIDVGNISTN